MNTHVYDAVIVGAGHNGLVTAAYLARSGLDVLVLERRAEVGGAVATEELFPGHRISSCSYVLHLMQEKIVTELGLREHGLQIYNHDPRKFHPFLDGSSLFTFPTAARQEAEIERISPPDVPGVRKWNAYWDMVGGLMNRYFLDPCPPTMSQLRSDLTGRPQGVALERAINGSLREMLDEYFVDDRVKTWAANQVLPAMKGIDEPGSLISAAALMPNRFGDPALTGIPRGGMGTVSGAIARAARAAGARLRTGAEVRRILTDDGGAAVGVELADGQLVRARTVISNAHLLSTIGLVDDDGLAARLTQGAGPVETDYAAMKFHAIVDELPDFGRWLPSGSDPRQLVHVNICPDLEYFAKSAQEAAAGRPTDHPLIAMQIPTVYDDSLAPPGHHIVSMWIRFVPTHPTGTTWSDIRQAEGQKMIDAVTAYAPNFQRSIIDWLLYTPDDIEARVGMIGGNIHHLTHNADQMLGDRGFGGGGYRTPVQGLYLCGASTHPGGEVSGAPGHNAAAAIINDLRPARQY